MSDPTSALFAGPLGVKIGAALGSLATLAFTANRLKKIPAAFSIVMGAISSIYLTDIVAHFWPSVKDIIEPVAFLLGLTSMNIVGGFMTKFTRFRRNGDLSEFKDVRFLR